MPASLIAIDASEQCAPNSVTLVHVLVTVIAALLHAERCESANSVPSREIETNFFDIIASLLTNMNFASGGMLLGWGKVTVI